MNNNSSRFLLRGCIRHSRKYSFPSPHHLSRRRFNLLRKKSEPESPSKTIHPLEENSKYLRLAQDNLFHPLISSPILNIRKKAMAIKSLAVCPTSGLLEGNEFTCPNCGFPTHCSEEHYRLDQERHERQTCDTLRQINEDLHDMQSGRQFPEFTLRRTPLPCTVFDHRTTINGKSIEFFRLGSYSIHSIDGNDIFRTVVTTCNEPPILPIHHRRCPPRKFPLQHKKQTNNRRSYIYGWYSPNPLSINS
jgi:hypothetical protein